jgi:hypothetical protein
MERERPIEAQGDIVWTAEALKRVEKAPTFVRPGIYKLMVKRAKERGQKVITSEFLTEIRNEAMLRVAKCIKGFGFEELSMDAFEVAKQKMRKLPRRVEVIEQIKAFLEERTQKNDSIIAKFTRYLHVIPEKGLPWTEEALVRIQKVPAFVREMAKQAIEEEAKRRKEKVITPEVVEQVSRTILPDPFKGAMKVEGRATGEAGRAEGPLEEVTMLWTAEAEERLRRIPMPSVRRMIIRRVEEYVKALGLEVVGLEAYEAGRGWQGR